MVVDNSLFKFDFVTSCQEVKTASVVKFEISLSLCVFVLVDVSWHSRNIRVFFPLYST